MDSEILKPVVALVLWSLVMWGWLYATRLPAMAALKVRLDPNQAPGATNAAMPARVRWKADNYNHLMEQPTLFYAVALVLAVAGHGDGLNAALAWGYVVCRVVHSLIQALVNIIQLRFVAFAAGSVVLIVMAIRAAVAVF